MKRETFSGVSRLLMASMRAWILSRPPLASRMPVSCLARSVASDLMLNEASARPASAVMPGDLLLDGSMADFRLKIRRHVFVRAADGFLCHLAKLLCRCDQRVARGNGLLSVEGLAHPAFEKIGRSHAHGVRKIGNILKRHPPAAGGSEVIIGARCVFQDGLHILGCIDAVQVDVARLAWPLWLVRAKLGRRTRRFGWGRYRVVRRILRWKCTRVPSFQVSTGISPRAGRVWMSVSGELPGVLAFEKLHSRLVAALHGHLALALRLK
jgi:hypothetical protein